MIRAITDQIIAPIIEALDWVDIFGGVAITTTKTTGTATDPVEFTYPVRVNRPDNCPPSQEPILSPEDRYKSVLWVQETSDVNTVSDPRFAKQAGLLNTQSIRILGWVNGKALGEQDYQWAYTPEQDIIRVLHNQRFNNFQLRNIGVGDDLPITRLKITVTGQAEKDSGDIFSDYTFGQEQKWFVKPYDFFAIDLEVEWIVLENCIPAYVANQPLNCPPGYQPPECGPIVSSCEGNLITPGEDGGACLTVADLPDQGRNGIFDILNQEGDVPITWVNLTADDGNGRALRFDDRLTGRSVSVPSLYVQQQFGGLPAPNWIRGIKIQPGSFGGALAGALFIPLDLNGDYSDDAVFSVGTTFNTGSQPFSVIGNGDIWMGLFGQGGQLGTPSYTLGVTVGGQVIEIPLTDSTNLNGIFTQENDQGTIDIKWVTSRSGSGELNEASTFWGAGHGFNDIYIGLALAGTTDPDARVINTGAKVRLLADASGYGLQVQLMNAFTADKPWFAIRSRDQPNQTPAVLLGGDLDQVHRFSGYGDGNRTAGPATFALAVDADGNIIETALGGGGSGGGIYDPGTGTTGAQAKATIADRLVFSLPGITAPGNLTAGYIKVRTPTNDGTGIPYQMFFNGYSDAAGDEVDLLNYGLGIGMATNGVSAHIGSTGFLSIRGDEYGTGQAEIVIGGGNGSTLDSGIFFTTAGGSSGTGGFRWRGQFVNQDESKGTAGQVWTLQDPATGLMGWTTPSGGGGGIFDPNNDDAAVGVSTIQVATDFYWVGENTLRSRNDGTNVRHWIECYRNNEANLNMSGQIVFRKANGTADSPADVVADDRIGSFLFQSVINGGNRNSAGFVAYQRGASTGNYESEITFETTRPNETARSAWFGFRGSDFFLYDYTGSNKDGTPVRALGVDGSGKVVTYTGVNPTAARSIDRAELETVNSDTTLPPITKVGQVHVVANQEPGGTIEVHAAAGNDIAGSPVNENIGDGEAGLFIAMNMTTWYRIKH